MIGSEITNKFPTYAVVVIQMWDSQLENNNGNGREKWL